MGEQPRLLLCTFDVVPAPTGSSRRSTEYLKGLSDRFNVVVLSAKTPDVSHIERYQGARLLRVPVGTGDLPSRLQAFDRAVRRQLESEEYSLVHFMDPFGGYALCEQRDSYGYRLVYEAEGFPSQELRYSHPQTEGDRRFVSRLKRQELYCLMNADRVVTGSSVTADFIHSLGVARDSIEVLPAPVDLPSYRAIPAPNGEPMRLLYLGSQVAWQGLPTLLRAVAHAVEQIEVHLVLVGPRHPDWQPRLSDLVDELGLAGRVEFQDPVSHDDLHKVLATCDVGVLPLDDSDRNRLQGGACAKVSEYFAAGRPVIASDLPLTRKLLPPGTSLFSKPGAAVELGERIVELASQPARRVEMGRKARAYAEEVLDASRIRGRLLDLYDALLEAPRRTRDSGEKAALAKETAIGAMPVRETPDTDPALSANTPLVIGRAISPDRDLGQPTTDPDARDAPAPVVLGTPLNEPDPTPPSRPPHTPSRGVAKPGPTTVPSLPHFAAEAGRRDPWLGQITQGYCPSDGEAFSWPAVATQQKPREDTPRAPRASGIRSKASRSEDSSPGFKP